MTIELILNRLGLPKHSGTIYTLLSRGEPLLATAIIKKTKLHRPAAYRALRELLKDTFIITKKIGKRRYYEAADPSRITAAFKNEEASSSTAVALLRRETGVEKISLPGGTTLRFYTGTTAITRIFADIIAKLHNRETFYRYTSETDTDFVNKYLPKNYRALRDKKKLERQVISNPLSASKKHSRLERFIHTLPQGDEVFSQNIIQLIYGDTVAIIDLTNLFGFTIENSTFAEFQKTIFRHLYKRLL